MQDEISPVSRAEGEYLSPDTFQFERDELKRGSRSLCIARGEYTSPRFRGRLQGFQDHNFI